MWEQVKRICKGAFVTTASQPFASFLITSNMDWFRYEWVWRKNVPSGFAYAKHQPLRYHENVLVFYNGSKIYNPQPTNRKSKSSIERNRYKLGVHLNPSDHIEIGSVVRKYDSKTKGPESVLDFDVSPRYLGTEHPTQKPVALYEYLIKTYTNEGDTVLDFCMGSGTTGVACVKTNRNFIGIEKKPEYFEIAQRRIQEARQQMVLFA